MEQTVPNWKPRKKTNKENNRFTYLLVVYIIQELEKATQKKNLEQTVPNWKPRKKTNKENNRFTYLLVVYIIQELEKATQKEN